jgi:hypothetical protein
MGRKTVTIMFQLNFLNKLLIKCVPRKLLFWAKQQQVAIPGWLREDQEEHFA